MYAIRFRAKTLQCLLIFFFFSFSLLPLLLFGGAPRIWQCGFQMNFYGFSVFSANRFLRLSHKKTHLSTLFIEKGTVPAISVVSNRQYKNIFVGLPKSRPAVSSVALRTRYWCGRSGVQIPGWSNWHSVANSSPPLQRSFGAV